MKISEVLEQLDKKRAPDPKVGRSGTPASAPVTSVRNKVVDRGKKRGSPAGRPRKWDVMPKSRYVPQEVELLAGKLHDHETVQAVLACNDYLRLGPNRTVTELVRRYKALLKGGDEANAITTSSVTIYNWCFKYDWRSRADLYDSEADAAKTEYAKKVMGSGLALSHLRVEELKKLALKLRDEIYVDKKLWLREKKLIGRGSTAEVFVVVRFNASLVEQFRGALSDLAEETGGRQKVQRNLNVNLDDLTDTQLELLAAGKSYDITNANFADLSNAPKMPEDAIEGDPVTKMEDNNE